MKFNEKQTPFGAKRRNCLFLGNGINISLLGHDYLDNCKWDNLLRFIINDEGEKEKLFDKDEINRKLLLSESDNEHEKENSALGYYSYPFLFDILIYYAKPSKGNGNAVTDISKCLKKRFSDRNNREIEKAINENVKKHENRDQAVRNLIEDLILFEGTDVIMTTNYDYLFEWLLEGNRPFKGEIQTDFEQFKPHKCPCESKSLTYPLRTYHEISNPQVQKTVFHVHGESGMINSIVLGNFHYCGMINNIKEKMNEWGYSKNKKQFLDNIRRSDLQGNGTQKPSDYSWIATFLKDDIYIIGFGLDRSELDIWYLLSMRANLLNDDTIRIDNRITYYLMNSSGDIDTKPKNFKDYMMKIALEALGVTVYTSSEMDQTIVESGDSYIDFYLWAAKDIQKKCGQRKN